LLGAAKLHMKGGWFLWRKKIY